MTSTTGTSKSQRVTQADFDVVVAEMVAVGIEPSTIEVRKRLGRGSNTTVGKLIAKWRSAQATANAPKPAVMPDIVAAGIASYIEGEIGQVRKHAHESIVAEQAIRETLEAQVDALEARVADLSEQLETLSQEREQIKGRLLQAQDDAGAERSRLLGDIKSAEGRAHVAEREVAVLTAKVDAALERVAIAERRERDARKP